MPAPGSAEVAALSPVDYASMTLDRTRSINRVTKNIRADAQTRSISGEYRERGKPWKVLDAQMEEYCTAKNGTPSNVKTSVQEPRLYCTKNDAVLFYVDLLTGRTEPIPGEIGSQWTWTYEVVEPTSAGGAQLLQEALQKDREKESARDRDRDAALAAIGRQRAIEVEAARRQMEALRRGAQICSKPGVYHFTYLGGLEEMQGNRLLVRIAGTREGYVRTGEPQAQDVIWSDVEKWEPCR